MMDSKTVIRFKMHFIDNLKSSDEGFSWIKSFNTKLKGNKEIIFLSYYHDRISENVILAENV